LITAFKVYSSEFDPIKLRVERQNFLADEFEGFSSGIQVMN